jgi:protein-tyrosine phosphatase
MYCILDKAVTLIRRLLANGKYKILIHCQAGQQRSVAVILAFIIKYTDVDLLTAQELLKTKWPEANGSNFLKALEQYSDDMTEINRI